MSQTCHTQTLTQTKSSIRNASNYIFCLECSGVAILPLWKLHRTSPDVGMIEWDDMQVGGFRPKETNKKVLSLQKNLLKICKI